MDIVIEVQFRTNKSKEQTWYKYEKINLRGLYINQTTGNYKDRFSRTPLGAEGIVNKQISWLMMIM